MSVQIPFLHTIWKSIIPFTSFLVYAMFYFFSAVIANALKQLFKIRASAALLKQIIVHSESLDKVLP